MLSRFSVQKEGSERVWRWGRGSSLGNSMAWGQQGTGGSWRGQTLPSGDMRVRGQVPSTYCFLCALQECLLMFLNSWMSIKRRGIVCDTVRWCDMKMLCRIHFAGILSFWLFLMAAFEWQCQSSEVTAQAVWPQIFGRSQIFATWSKKECWPCSRGLAMRASQKGGSLGWCWGLQGITEHSCEV